MSGAARHPLRGRTVYVPWMGTGSTRLFCAGLRGAGIAALPVPGSDRRTLELAAPHVTDQCYPQRVTLGNFLKLVTAPGFDPAATAFFMPRASGPCRFGQYAGFTRRVLASLGAGEVLLLSPTFDDGYAALGENGTLAMRHIWWGLAMADVLQRVLHRLRPGERDAGAVQRVHDDALAALDAILSDPRSGPRARFRQLRRELALVARRFAALAVDRSPRPLIGIVGEIFCRLDEFSNEEIVRRVEAGGGEAWLAGLCEWVHYANHWERVELRAAGRAWSPRYLRSWLSSRVQHRDEQLLHAPFAALLADRREPDSVARVLALAHPYLPAAAGLGEMTLSLGRAAWLHRQGVAGILDISPFGCMNGMVSEAIYPRLSRDHGDLPIRTLYFDGTGRSDDLELELFLALTRRHTAP